jgi:hypothetical protein
MSDLFNFSMSRAQAERIHQMAKSHIYALKNYMQTAVERDDLPKAKEYAAEIRAYQAIFAAFNMEAKIDIAEMRGKTVERNTVVCEANF